MAVRLQLKLGVVTEHDRLADSPDTLVVVEPSVGSVARSKGHLYLLVTSRVVTRHALEATRLAAETIRNEYYYDESAGIRVCLQKAIATANKRLAHQADRLGLKSTDGGGPIGIGVAVVRANEMYVATVGPAEAYLIRQARLSTLPGPASRARAATPELEPDVWRGEVSVGDSLVLISPNVIAKLGADELKDAMLTLHPQSAMEHLHHRFVAADGTGQRRGDRLRGDRGVVDGQGPDARAGSAVGAARRRPRPLADPPRRQRPGRRAGGEHRGRQRPRRGRRGARAGGRLGPGTDAPAQAGLPARDPAGVPARDPAPRGPGRARPDRGRRRPRARRLLLRGQRHAGGGDQLGHRRPAGDRRRNVGPGQGDRPRDRPRRRRSRTRRCSC